MPDDLYERYITAHRALTTHRTSCAACQARAGCRIRDRLIESFTRLQDAYLIRIKQSGR